MGIDYSIMKFPKGENIKKKTQDISTKTRKLVNELYQGRCGLCGGQANHLHHIIYRSEDKSLIDNPDNLIPLCFDCHQKVHRNKKEWQKELLQVRKNK